MPSEDNVQILKESKARFEGVIFKQTADLGTHKETSCKVIDEATGEVIAQSGGGGGGGGESDLTTANVTIIFDESITDAQVTVNIPQLLDAEDVPEGFTAGLYTIPVPVSDDQIVKVPLYKGCLIFDPKLPGSTITVKQVDGDIVKDPATLSITITGDGSITLSDSK